MHSRSSANMVLSIMPDSSQKFNASLEESFRTFAASSGTSVGFARVLAGIESTWTPTEINEGRDPALGLFQVRLSLWSKLALAVGAKSWKDPVDNARVAASVYKENMRLVAFYYKKKTGRDLDVRNLHDFERYIVYQQGPAAFKILLADDGEAVSVAMKSNDAAPRRSRRVGEWREAWRVRWDRLQTSSSDKGVDV